MIFGKKDVVHQIQKGGAGTSQTQIWRGQPGSFLTTNMNELPEMLFELKNDFLGAGFSEEQAFELVKIAFENFREVMT